MSLNCPKSECESEWLYVSMGFSDGLATCPEFTSPLAQCQKDMGASDSNDLERKMRVKMDSVISRLHPTTSLLVLLAWSDNYI